jgi:hypothetical protein
MTRYCYNFSLSTTENGTTTRIADDLAGVPFEGFETYEEAEMEAETAILELHETRPDIVEVSYRVYEYEVDDDS